MSPQIKLRMTPQRRIILQLLREAHSHPTADELFHLVRETLPRISLGTVYRNLETLSSCGLIRKLELGGTQKRFDAETYDHCHVRCIRCGRVDDVAGHLSLSLEELVCSLKRGGEGDRSQVGLSTLEECLKSISDYEIVGHRLEFMGICPSCTGAGKKTLSSSADGEGA